MTSASQELAALSLAELLDVYKRTVLERYATQHIGRANRLGAKRGRILKAIEQRANGTLHALLPLAEDADPRIRLAAASACKAIDRERYLRIAQELAERRDEIGREARDALHWDELLARTGPSQAPTVPRDAATSALPALPAGIGSADLEARLHEAFPTALADALLAKAQPAIRLWPRAAQEGEIVSSHLGGLPSVPPSWNWPRSEEEPLLFLGQVDCRAMLAMPGARPLPQQGILAFFGDHDAVMGCGAEVSAQWAVYHWRDPAALVPTQAPVEDFKVLPRCELQFFETLELPHPWSAALQDQSFTEEERSRYWDLQHELGTLGASSLTESRVSRLLGWPNLLQRELYSLEGARVGSKPRLLLQLGSYENGRESWDWADSGLVYFTIAERDLARRRFDRVRMEMQSG